MGHRPVFQQACGALIFGAGLVAASLVLAGLNWQNRSHSDPSPPFSMIFGLTGLAFSFMGSLGVMIARTLKDYEDRIRRLEERDGRG